MWIFGLILLALAAGLAFAARSKRRRLGRILSTEVCTVSHLRELARSMAEGLGAGSLRFPAAIEGEIHCTEPLISPLTETPSVYFSYQVQLEIEEPAPRGSDKERGPSRTSDSVARQTQQTDFEIRDATGSLRVAVEGARWKSSETLARFEASGEVLRRVEIGQVALDLPARGSGERQNLGLRFREEAVPNGSKAYVLGEVTDPGGELRISTPEEGEPLLVSLEGREQLIRNMGSGSKGLTIGAVICGVLGLLLLL